MSILEYMKILLASNNDHKREEFSRIFDTHTVALPRDLSLAFDFEETKETFTENALDKAMALRSLAPEGWVVLADDSGLCVDALGGGPGVRTARYGQKPDGTLLESGERNQYLLKNLSHLTTLEERSAHFVCALALVVNEHRIYTVCEHVDGFIAFEASGSTGFGYDPVFIVEAVGAPMATLAEGEKDRYSHRGVASRRMKTILEEIEL